MNPELRKRQPRCSSLGQQAKAPSLCVLLRMGFVEPEGTGRVLFVGTCFNPLFIGNCSQTKLRPHPLLMLDIWLLQDVGSKLECYVFYLPIWVSVGLMLHQWRHSHWKISCQLLVNKNKNTSQFGIFASQVPCLRLKLGLDTTLKKVEVPDIKFPGKCCLIRILSTNSSFSFVPVIYTVLGSIC